MSASDRERILDTLAEIAWIFDHKQWERIGEVFTADAEAYGRHGLEAIVANTKRYLAPIGPTQHLVGSVRVRVNGDMATSVSYVRAFHRSAEGASPASYEFLGEYQDDWVRVGDGWQISRRVCVPIAESGDLVLPVRS